MLERYRTEARQLLDDDPRAKEVQFFTEGWISVTCPWKSPGMSVLVRRSGQVEIGTYDRRRSWGTGPKHVLLDATGRRLRPLPADPVARAGTIALYRRARETNDAIQRARLSNDPDELRLLAAHRDRRVRLAAAGNRHTPADALEALSRGRARRVAEQAAATLATLREAEGRQPQQRLCSPRAGRLSRGREDR
jgi:glyoxylase-like metal-dependent hydrolase (beta-lactamase superfamily II)